MSWEILILHYNSDFIGFLHFFFSIWKLYCFAIWLGIGTNLCCWLRLFCTLIDHSVTISLVWTTCDFYLGFEGFCTLKILVPLFVIVVIYYFCSLIVAPHRFLQVRGNYIRYSLWYILYVVVFPITLFSTKAFQKQFNTQNKKTRFKITNLLQSNNNENMLILWFKCISIYHHSREFDIC